MSYNFLHEDAFDGSLLPLPTLHKAVWAYIIAKAKPHHGAIGGGAVRLVPRLMAVYFSDQTLEDIEAAIRVFTEPDPNTRTDTHDGRKLIPMGRDLYALPTYSTHAGSRLARDAERKRVYRASQHAPEPEPEHTPDPVEPTEPAPPVAEKRVIQNRRHGNGANEPGSLPRDHMNHRICGGPASNVCFTYNQYDALAKRFPGATHDSIDASMNEFRDYVVSQIPNGKFMGDMLWLLRHFDAWMVESGRVAPAPTKNKKSKTPDFTEDEAAALLKDMHARDQRLRMAR